MAHVMLDSSMLFASSTWPLGMQKALSNFCPVATNAFLALSLVVPMFDVTPLSAMAEGMDPLRTPSFILLKLFTCWLLSLFCSSTRQLGGAVLSNIE
jgi:hypothetical protein